MKKKKIKFLWPLIALTLCGLIIFLERSGNFYVDDNKAYENYNNTPTYTQEVVPVKETLIVLDSRVDISQKYYESMVYILDSLSVGYESVDLATTTLPPLEKYRNVVLSISDLSVLKADLAVLLDWVKSGGHLMNTYTFEPGNYLQGISGKIGILDGGLDYTLIDKIEVEEGSMIGGGKVFDYGKETGESLALLVNEDCKVHIHAKDSQVPVLWETSYGDGKVVIINKEDHSKINRGFLTTAYSLLQDAFAYPVINGSAYYIDDFLAPIPEGNNEYIEKDYEISISEFYMNEWWPSVINWEEEYGIVHTGMIIESYSDQVQGPFPRQKNIDKYIFYGSMLINNGGELGLHGYNHMPLCLKGFDYKGNYPEYKLWPDVEEMKSGVNELYQFSTKLFPEQDLATYVPPSDILSNEGRKLLAQELPNLKAISSIYLPQEGGCEYVQEFDIGEDGIVNTPRVVSGCIIDSYSELAVLSELNFHYVQSHFLHPDDALDPERGAELGWKELNNRFENYLQWITSSAPNIRNVTASQMGHVVEQYSKLSLNRTYAPNEMTLQLGGYSGEAYLMLRMNKGTPKKIEGGSFDHITGDLYLINAQQEIVKIYW